MAIEKEERKCEGCKLYGSMGVHSLTCPTRKEEIHINFSSYAPKCPCDNGAMLVHKHINSCKYFDPILDKKEEDSESAIADISKAIKEEEKKPIVLELTREELQMITAIFMLHQMSGFRSIHESRRAAAQALADKLMLLDIRQWT